MGKDEIVINLEDEDVVGENKEALQYTLLIRAMLAILLWRHRAREFDAC
jgi:hypothetical protein